MGKDERQRRCAHCRKVMKKGKWFLEVDRLVCLECTEFKEKVADKNPNDVVDMLLRTAAEGVLSQSMYYWLEKYIVFCTDLSLVDKAKEELKRQGALQLEGFE